MLYVAPMMAWTDRHCRYLHRLFSPSAVLFTEMVSTGALTHGKQWHQLAFNPEEHPVVLQLGGNDPEALAYCANEAFQRGFDEVNLNVGCPSDRVQNGAFGACLMKQPERVAACVAAMTNLARGPISVKCRLGVDGADSDELLDAFVETVSEAGCHRFYVHARIAILAGLSPAQNRDIPPLQPERVRALKERFPHLEIIVNGGVTDLDTFEDYRTWSDGVMIGRAAFHDPSLLNLCHQRIIGDSDVVDRQALMQSYAEYAAKQFTKGVRLQALIKPLLGTCNGMPGARSFRRTLSDHRRLQAGDLSIFQDAFEQVYRGAAA
ncbi:MAG: tRNA dihydrouridine(20/20a) synthase DusA [Pseudomonadales bacterium]|nr:tRNA dihydrouridine(20/20a) synthase DusA [Pseudomonadales bacterium]